MNATNAAYDSRQHIRDQYAKFYRECSMTELKEMLTAEGAKPLWKELQVPPLSESQFGIVLYEFVPAEATPLSESNMSVICDELAKVEHECGERRSHAVKWGGCYTVHIHKDREIGEEIHYVVINDACKSALAMAAALAECMDSDEEHALDTSDLVFREQSALEERIAEDTRIGLDKLHLIGYALNEIDTPRYSEYDYQIDLQPYIIRCAKCAKTFLSEQDRREWAIHEAVSKGWNMTYCGKCDRDIATCDWCQKAEREDSKRIMAAKRVFQEHRARRKYVEAAKDIVYGFEWDLYNGTTLGAYLDPYGMAHIDYYDVDNEKDGFLGKVRLTEFEEITTSALFKKANQLRDALA